MDPVVKNSISPGERNAAQQRHVGLGLDGDEGQRVLRQRIQAGGKHPAVGDREEEIAVLKRNRIRLRQVAAAVIGDRRAAADS
jgi:hypothetical protein